MKLIWWRIYLGVSVVMLLLYIVAQVADPIAPVGLFIADGVSFGLSIIGVYSYLFKKPIFEPRFWKYFFWFNIVYAALYIVYLLAPNAPFVQYLSFLTYDAEQETLLTAVLWLMISYPALFANYKLSQEKYFEPKTKKQEEKDLAAFRWNMVQTALWGYSLVLLIIIELISLLPQNAQQQGEGDSFDATGSLIFAPILLFWAWVAFEYKLYRWNWWKITLFLNSLLFSGLIILGSLFYEPMQEAVATENPDLIGMLQFLIIIIALIVFGREQLQPKKKHVVKEKGEKHQTSNVVASGK